MFRTVWSLITNFSATFNTDKYATASAAEVGVLGMLYPFFLLDLSKLWYQSNPAKDKLIFFR